MKDKIVCAIISLLKLKTIITLGVTALFIVLSIKNQIPVETITMIIGMVFTYYFSKNDLNDT